MESQKPELEQQDVPSQDLEVTRMSSHHGEPSSDYVVPLLHHKKRWDLDDSWSYADCKLQFNSEEESSSSKATLPASNDKEDVHKDLALKNVRHFILDEYDKMLEPDEMKIGVAEILEMTPHDKQVMMFSATLSTEIHPVCKNFKRDPKEVYFDDKLTLHDLTLHYIKLSEKNCKLNDHLDALDLNQVVIIVKSVSRAAELNKLLVDRNFPPSMGYVGIQCSGFEDFHLKPGLLQAIVDSTFEYPSEVQQQCIPRAILGGDVLCQAKAGTGKSAVFVLSTLQQIEPVAGQVAALVLCHTRELSCEIYCEFKTFSTHLPDIKVAVFNGDVEINIHKDTLKNNCPHILVGTLGRIRALARDKDLPLKNVRHFILDECDKMLEPDAMKTGVVEILEMTPRDKQVMMFSATLSTEIRSVCTNFMRDPIEVYFDDEAMLTLAGLAQHYIKLSKLQKNRKLNDLLDALDFNQVVIFFKSLSRAAELNKLLVDLKFPSICIYSGMSLEEGGYIGIQCSGFEDFHLKPGLLQAIVDSTFEYPSEVQQQCIPRAILGGDVLCQAKAGTGKSAVFVLSTLQQIEPVAGQVAALVLCHTRELSYEIYCEFKTFSTHLPDIKVAVFNGDVEIDIHKDTLKNNCPHILVGTLGTIRALARDKDLALKNVRHFILDECDKMLEPDAMKTGVVEILEMTPRDKQVMMFSATLSTEIRSVCTNFMRDVISCGQHTLNLAVLFNLVSFSW